MVVHQPKECFLYLKETIIKMQSKRKPVSNYISFASDIVDDVYDKFEKKFTKDQIYQILIRSVDFYHYLLRYEDPICVGIPFLANSYVSLDAMKARRDSLVERQERNRSLKVLDKVELDRLEDKIERVSKLKTKKGSSYKRNFKYCMYTLKCGREFGEIEDIQNSKEF